MGSSQKNHSLTLQSYLIVDKLYTFKIIFNFFYFKKSLLNCSWLQTHTL